MSIIHRINQHRYVRKYCKCAIQMFTFNNNKTSIKHLFLLTLFGSSFILYFVNQTKIDDIIKMTYFSNNLQTLHIYCYFNLLVFFQNQKSFIAHSIRIVIQNLLAFDGPELSNSLTDADVSVDEVQ